MKEQHKLEFGKFRNDVTQLGKELEAKKVKIILKRNETRRNTGKIHLTNVKLKEIFRKRDTERKGFESNKC